MKRHVFPFVTYQSHIISSRQWVLDLFFFFLSIDLFILAIGLAAPVLQTEQLLLLQSVHFDVFLYACRTFF